MNKEEFRAKAYPILLEALLRATNGDNVQVLANGVDEKQEAIVIICKMINPIDIRILGLDSFELENKAVVRIALDSRDGYNHTLEIL